MGGFDGECGCAGDGEVWGGCGQKMAMYGEDAARRWRCMGRMRPEDGDVWGGCGQKMAMYGEDAAEMARCASARRLV